MLLNCSSADCRFSVISLAIMSGGGRFAVSSRLSSLSPQHKEILDNICIKLGQSESETLRVVFVESAKSISLIADKVHGGNRLQSLVCKELLNILELFHRDRSHPNIPQVGFY